MSGLPPDVADKKRKGCKPMSDKLLFWVNKAVECEEENKRLEQRINLLQIAGDEAIKQRNDALRERDEARAEVEELREALEHIAEYWNRNRDDGAMHDALWHIIETAEQALEGGGE
jgi:seryl-tRNA synthetase